MSTPQPNSLTELPVRPVGGVPFRVAGFGQAVAAVLAAAGQVQTQGSSGVAVHFANAYTVALADDDPDFAELFTAPTSVTFTDGVPVAWIGRRQHPDVAQDWDRVYGPDVMTGVLAASTPEGPRHYLLGGAPETLDLLRGAIAERWPDARIVGAESPPFRPLSAAEQAEASRRIDASGADIVWVGLGTPKQDWEVARIAAASPVVAMAVGAAFDFLAGTKPQAPQWLQRAGLEWGYRLATEPRRLGRRYLWGNPRFLAAAWRGRLDR
ncbi:MAG: hypothetical protein RLZ55_617 [Actinomycetota bacterium]